MVLLTSAQSHDSFLVTDISTFADDRQFHLVEGALEELEVVPDEEALDAGELTLALGDVVDVDALHEHLDKGRALGELRPGQGQAVQRNRELVGADAPYHQLQQADAEGVNVLQHQQL